MRPNLQLLLAYLDETLTPEAASQAAACLEECEEAEALETRIRDVTRRLRLGAPELLGETTLDLNLSAEFLDRTLALEQAAEVERECLDSDLLLAEVAACHQVLALALGEPARVPAATRRKLYALPEKFLPPPPPKPERARRHKGESAAAIAPPQAQPAAPAAPPAPPVASLRQRTERWAKRWGTPAVVGGLAICASVLAWSHFSEPWLAEAPQNAEDDHTPAGPRTALFPSPTGTNPFSPQIEIASSPANTAPASPFVTLPPSGDPGSTGSSEPPPWRTNEGPATPSQPSVPPLAAYPSYPPARDPVEPSSVDQQPLTGPERTVAYHPENHPEVTQLPAPRGLRPLGTLRPARLPGRQEATSGPPASPSLPASPGDPRSMALRPAVSPAAHVAPNEALGKLLSTDQLVCIQGPRHEAWQPLSSSMPLAAGDRLLAPPEFRPTLALGDLVVELPPESMVEIEAADAEGVPRLRVLYGRVVLRGTQRSRGLWVASGSWNAKVAFDGETGAVAIEVRPFRAPGADPEIAPEEQAIDLYAVQGRSFLDDGASLATCDAPLRTAISPFPGEQIDARAQPPAWTHTHEQPGSEVLRARTLIANKLAPGEAASSAIRLAARDRQHPEVRQLAARWLGLTGEFEHLWLTVSDAEQRPAQREQALRALRDGLARGPEWALRVLEGCQAAYRDGAAERYRMLWGYTSEQLQSGGAATLVAALDHDDMGLRALAFWNLQAATGQSFLYRPEMSATQRRQSVERWKARMLSE